MGEQLANAIEVYELLKSKIGEQEAKALLRFIEEKPLRFMPEEAARWLATKEDLAKLKEDLTKLEVAIREEIWRTRLYLVAIGALIILTNPKVLEFLGRLLGIVPK
jgi:hypothetical protein